MALRHLPATQSRCGGATPSAFPIRPLLLIALAGVLVRLAIVAATPAWSLTTDGHRYWQLASSWMRGTAFVPPLYPFFIAVIRTAGGDGIWTVRAAQSLLGGATILLTGSIAWTLAPQGRAPGRATVLAALLAAFAPPLLLADVTVMAESVAALLTTGFLVAAQRGMSVGAGLLLGLGALCRAPLFAYTIVRAGLLLLLDIRRQVSWRALVVSTAVAAAVVAPWTVRNAFLFGRLVPVSTNGGYNFWKAFNKDAGGTHNRHFDLSRFADVEERDLDAAGYAEGLLFIRAHPGRAATLSVLKEGYLWGIERSFFIGLRDGTWGPLPGVLICMAAVSIPLTQLFWVCFAPLGLIRAPSSPLRREGLMLIAFTAAFHLVFHAEARYHIPLVPLLLAAASAGIAGASGRRAPGGERSGPPGPAQARMTGAQILAALIASAVVLFWIFELLAQRLEIAGALGL